MSSEDDWHLYCSVSCLVQSYKPDDIACIVSLQICSCIIFASPFYEKRWSELWTSSKHMLLPPYYLPNRHISPTGTQEWEGPSMPLRWQTPFAANPTNLIILPATSTTIPTEQWSRNNHFHSKKLWPCLQVYEDSHVEGEASLATSWNSSFHHPRTWSSLRECSSGLRFSDHIIHLVHK